MEINSPENLQTSEMLQQRSVLLDVALAKGLAATAMHAEGGDPYVAP